MEATPTEVSSGSLVGEMLSTAIKFEIATRIGRKLFSVGNTLMGKMIRNVATSSSMQRIARSVANNSDIARPLRTVANQAVRLRQFHRDSTRMRMESAQQRAIQHMDSMTMRTPEQRNEFIQAAINRAKSVPTLSDYFRQTKFSQRVISEKNRRTEFMKPRTQKIVSGLGQYGKSYMHMMPGLYFMHKQEQAELPKSEQEGFLKYMVTNAPFFMAFDAATRAGQHIISKTIPNQLKKVKVGEQTIHSALSFLHKVNEKVDLAARLVRATKAGKTVQPRGRLIDAPKRLGHKVMAIADQMKRELRSKGEPDAGSFEQFQQSLAQHEDHLRSLYSGTKALKNNKFKQFQRESSVDNIIDGVRKQYEAHAEQGAWRHRFNDILDNSRQVINAARDSAGNVMGRGYLEFQGRVYDLHRLNKRRFMSGIVGAAQKVTLAGFPIANFFGAGFLRENLKARPFIEQISKNQEPWAVPYTVPGKDHQEIMSSFFGKDQEAFQARTATMREAYITQLTNNQQFLKANKLEKIQATAKAGERADEMVLRDLEEEGLQLAAGKFVLGGKGLNESIYRVDNKVFLVGRGREGLYRAQLGYDPVTGLYREFNQVTGKAKGIFEKTILTARGSTDIQLQDGSIKQVGFDTGRVLSREEKELEKPMGRIRGWLWETKRSLELGGSTEPSVFRMFKNQFSRFTDFRSPNKLMSRDGIFNPNFLNELRDDATYAAKVGQDVYNNLEQVSRKVYHEVYRYDNAIDIIRNQLRGKGHDESIVDRMLIRDTDSTAAINEKLLHAKDYFKDPNTHQAPKHISIQMRKLGRRPEAANVEIHRVGGMLSGRSFTMADDYNNTVLRELMNKNDISSVDVLEKLTIGKHLSPNSTMGKYMQAQAGFEKVLGNIQKEAEVAAKYGDSKPLVDVLESLGTQEAAITNVMSKEFGIFKPWQFNQDVKAGSIPGITSFLIPKNLEPHGNAFMRKEKFKYNYNGQQVEFNRIKGDITPTSMSTMMLFESVNRVSALLGMSWDEGTTRTPGDVLKKMMTKRILPGIAFLHGWDATDTVLDETPIFDRTPVGEGLNVFLANQLVGFHLGTQSVMDATGLTDAAKYMEGLMPGSVTSPLSGALRGFGPMFLGAGLGMMKGPTGGLIGGAIGAGVGALLGGGPLGIFGSWDISKSREELIKEYSGQQEVAIRKGRWWETGSSAFEGNEIEYFRPNWYARLRSDYRDAPNFLGTMGDKFNSMFDSDYYAKKHFYSRPYPIQSATIGSTPIVNEVIGIGRTYRQDPVTGNSTAEDYQQGDNLGLPQDSFFKDAPSPISQDSLYYKTGEAHYRITEMVGLKGFGFNALKEKLTGEFNVNTSVPIIESSDKIDSLSRWYWDLNLNGMLGLSEAIRRFIPRSRTEIESYNPIRNTMTWLPSEDYFVDFQHGDPFCCDPDSLVETGPLSFEKACDVITNKKVFTHKGKFERVSNFIERQPLEQEQIYQITCNTLSAFPLTVSENHPLLVTQASSDVMKSQLKYIKAYEHANKLLDIMYLHKNSDNEVVLSNQDIASIANVSLAYTTQLRSMLVDDGFINQTRFGMRNKVTILNNKRYDIELKKRRLEWVEAKDIQPNMYVAYPKPVIENDSQPVIIDLASLMLNYIATDDYVYYNTTNESFIKAYEYLENNGIPKFNWGERSKLLFNMGIDPKSYENATRALKDGAEPYRVKRYITLNSDLCYLLGVYLAEGSANNQNINISLHKKEDYIYNRLESIYRASPFSRKDSKFTVNYYENRGNGVSITFGNEALSLLVNYLCGKHSHHKKLNDIITTLDRNSIISFLKGYIDGDGSAFIDANSGFNKSGRYTISIRTVNKYLALQIRKLLLYVGYVASVIYNKKPNHNPMINGKIVNSNESYSIVIRGNNAIKLGNELGYSTPDPKETTSTWYWQDDSYYYLRIAEIENVTSSYNKSLIGTEVEIDNSFCVQGIATHNTKIKEGELRLPGAAYEQSHSVDLTAPLDASLFGFTPQEQALYYFGDPKFLYELNNANETVAKYKESILTEYKAKKLLTRYKNTKYDPNLDMTARVDAVIAGELGPTAVTIAPMVDGAIAPNIVGGMNAYLNMANIYHGMIMGIDASSGQIEEISVKKDVQRYQKDVESGLIAREIFMKEYGKRKQKGLPDNYMNAYSHVDRLKILADVAPYSKEYKDELTIVNKLEASGKLDPRQLEKKETAIAQREKVISGFEGSKRRFYNVGTAATEEEMKRQERVDKQYSGVEQLVGGAWEFIRDLNNPVSTKLLHNQDVLDEYANSEVYGRGFQLWQNPIDDFVAPYTRRLMAQTDPVQGFFSGGLGGYILGGPLGGALGSLFGAGYSAVNSVTGIGTDIPGYRQQERDINEYFDALEYQKWMNLYSETGNDQYKHRAAATIAGSLQKPTIDKDDVIFAAQKPEKRYIREILNLQTVEERERALKLLPGGIGELVRSYWDGATPTKDVDELLHGYAAPGAGWSGYKEDFNLSDIQVKVMEEAGLNAHDVGLGWYDQQRRIDRYRQAIPGTIDDLPSSFGQSPSPLNVKDAIASELGGMAEVTIRDDGNANATVILRLY